jgi:quaternary ammonium compound-resistance protein SugE
MSAAYAWIILGFAGLLEICWAVSLKSTQGFTRLGPSLFTLVCLAGSMYLLAKATQVLPLGTAYAIWVGIGTLGASMIGILYMNESASPQRIAFLILLFVSLIGLKLTAD